MNSKTAVSGLQISDKVSQQIQSLKCQVAYGQNVACGFEDAVSNILRLPFTSQVGLLRFLKQAEKLQGVHLVHMVEHLLSPNAERIKLAASRGNQSDFDCVVSEIVELCFTSCFESDRSCRLEFSIFIKLIDMSLMLFPAQSVRTLTYNEYVHHAVNLYTALQNTDIQRAYQTATPTLDFFKNIFSLLSRRLHEGNFESLVQQTELIILLDGDLNFHERIQIDLFREASNDKPSAFVLREWMILLDCLSISTAFVLQVAKHDPLLTEKAEYVSKSKTIGHQVLSESLLCLITRVLQKICKRENDFELLEEEKGRLDIFFKHVDFIMQFPELSLRLLTAVHISNRTISEFLTLIQYKKRLQPFSLPGFRFQTAKEAIWQSLGEALLLLNDSTPIIKVIKFWKSKCSLDSDGLQLNCLAQVVDAIFSTGSKKQNLKIQQMSALLKCMSEMKEPVIETFDRCSDLLLCLIKTFPETWHDSAVLDLVQRFCNLDETLASWKLQEIKNSIINLTDQMARTKTEMAAKLKMIRLYMDLAPKASKELHFMADFLLLVLPIVQKEHLENLIREIFEQVEREDSSLSWGKLFQAVQALVIDSSIKDKATALEQFLSLLQNIGENTSKNFLLDDLIRSLGSLPSQSSVSWLLESFADPNKSCCCAFIPKWFLSCRDRANLNAKAAQELISILITIVEKTFCFDKEKCVKFNTVLESFCGNSFETESVRVHDSTRIDVFVVAAAGAISVGAYDEEIERLCCFVLQCLRLDDAVQTISVYRRLRHLLLNARDTITSKLSIFCSGVIMDSKEREEAIFDATKAFTRCLAVLASMPASPEIQYLMMKHVNEVLVNTSEDILRSGCLERALQHIVTFPAEHNRPLLDDELSNVDKLLKSRELIQQLGKFPVKCVSTSVRAHQTFSTVLLKGIPEALKSRDIVTVYSQLVMQVNSLTTEHLQYVVNLFEAVVVASQYLKDVLTKLKEINSLLPRALLHSNDVVSLAINCLAVAYRLAMVTSSRVQLLEIILCQWQECISSDFLFHLEIPQLMVTLFSMNMELEQKHQLVKTTNQVLSALSKAANEMSFHGRSLMSCYCYSGEIKHREMELLSRELQWMIQLNPPLSVTDLILVLELCLQSLPYALQWLDCSRFARVQDIFTESMLQSHSGEMELATNPQPRPILTPGIIAKELVGQLHTISRGEEFESEVVREKAGRIWSWLFSENTRGYLNCSCAFVGVAVTQDEPFRIVKSVLQRIKFPEILLFWLDNLTAHQFIQLENVLYSACEWGAADDDQSSLEEGLKLHCTVKSALDKLLESKKDHQYISTSVACYAPVMNDLEILVRILRKNLDFELTSKLLELLNTSLQLSEVCCGIITSSWSKDSAKELINMFINLSRAKKESELDSQHKAQFVISFLCIVGHHFVGSAEAVELAWDKLVKLYDPEDDQGLGRILENYQRMINYPDIPSEAISSWCTSFIFANDVNSRDIDAICDLVLTDQMHGTPCYESIGQCLFSRDLSQRLWQQETGIMQDTNSSGTTNVAIEYATGEVAVTNANQDDQEMDEKQGAHFVDRANTTSLSGEPVIFQDSKSEQSTMKAQTVYVEVNEQVFKKYLRLARLLKEFLHIAQHQPLEETALEACSELCRCIQDQRSSTSDLYKIHHRTLTKLFAIVFLKNETNLDIKHKIFESLLILLRRFLTGITRRPSMMKHVVKAVELLVNEEPATRSASQCPGAGKTNILQRYVLTLPENEAAMASLRSAGYNRAAVNADSQEEDLWYRPCIELPCYVSKRVVPGKQQMIRALRNIWSEWRHLLSASGHHSITINGNKVKVNQLFSYTNSIEEMERQAAAVKESTKDLSSRPELEAMRQRLVRKEGVQRAKFQKLQESRKDAERRTENPFDGDSNSGNKVKKNAGKYRKRKNHVHRVEDGRNITSETKLVIVWENRFLESVKLCSDKIPGCYAPNGFHSEKPVLCGLTVDSRILTVFKEEKSGRREELENAEVKLLPAGLYVYGLYSGGHEFVTDELWAAFYKMLLEQKQVPKIFLSNITPAFEWIRKFVKSDPGHPPPQGLEILPSIIPIKEDFYDYVPQKAARQPKLLARHGINECITLTPSKVKTFKFEDLKDAKDVEKRQENIRHLTCQVTETVKDRLAEMHSKTKVRDRLLRRLGYVINQTVSDWCLRGNAPTAEFVKSKIDMKKLECDFEEEVRFMGQDKYVDVIIGAVLGALK